MGKLVDSRQLQVNVHESICDAMKSLDKYVMQIVLIVDNEGHLVGTMTDGDIRRALLKGYSLTDSVESVMNPNPLVGLLDEKDSAWLSRMRESNVKSLPIVDYNNKVYSLFTLKSRSRRVHETPVVLMLGGLGTRLRPLTENIPKPMLKVGGKPIVETIFEQFVEQGFSRFYFCINYLGHHIREYFGDGSQWNVSITYVEENERMGTAGALSLLPETPNESVIVMNGDLLTKVDFAQLMKHHQSTEALATICTREYTHQIPYGVIEVDSDEVQSIVEKPVTSHQVSAGVYALSPEAIEKIPNNTFYDMPALVEDLMKDSLKVTAFPITEYWLDIGNPTDFNRAQDDFTMHF